MDIFTNLFVHAVALSALAVVAVQQILKLKFIPWDFPNKYPVPTLIILSAGASVVTVWQSTLAPRNWTDWLLLGATIAVTSALTYITTLKNWKELRDMETQVQPRV